MFVCGINSSPEKMAKGENNNCRVYEVRDNECVYLELSISRDLTSTLLYIRLMLLTALGTLDAKEIEDYQVGAISGYAMLYSLIIYQRVTVLSPDGGYLAAAGAHDVSELSSMNLSYPNSCLQLSILTFPALATATTRIERGEIYDVSFSASNVCRSSIYSTLCCS